MVAWWHGDMVFVFGVLFYAFCFSCHISRLTTSDFPPGSLPRQALTDEPALAGTAQAANAESISEDFRGFQSTIGYHRVTGACEWCAVSWKLDCVPNNIKQLGRSSTSTDMQRSTRTCRDQVKTCGFNGRCVKRCGSWFDSCFVLILHLWIFLTYNE